MTQTNKIGMHWLLQAIHSVHPEITLPESAKLSKNSSALWAQLESMLHLSAAQIATAAAEAYQLEPGNLEDLEIDNNTKVQEELLRRLEALPLKRDGGEYIVAVSDPRLTPDQLSQLKFSLNAPIRLVVLSPDEIDTGVTYLFSQLSNDASNLGIIDLLLPVTGDEDRHTVELAAAIFKAAIDKRASDIHIHPFVGGGAIRFRVDGLLQRISTVPYKSLQSLSLYLKTNAGLDINPLIAQDGRLQLKYGSRRLDVRLSILPAVDGDRIVCRLLEQGKSFSLKNSGFSPSEHKVLQQLIGQGAGMVLLTGPTGSGKTSTLYALLAELNSYEINIMTLENPVEYTLPGISQIQINDNQGLSFADTLRSILRQDPDVILVGEIRDSETARIAAQAALTGHTVLSTLHTNDALGTIPRLLDLGLEPSTLADSLIGIVSQRLVRKLCSNCKVPLTDSHSPHEEEFLAITSELPAARAGGCESCSHTGYSGRIPIIESQRVSSDFRSALLQGVRNIEELKKAGGSLHRSMAVSAINWIVSGETTAEEVTRVMGLHFWHLAADEYSKNLSDRVAQFSTTKDQGGTHKALLISDNASIEDAIKTHLHFDLIRVDNAAAAHTLLADSSAVACLLIDSSSLQGTIKEWITGLRTETAWSGIPAIFLIRQDESELKEVLSEHEAMWLETDNSPASELGNEINQLLQSRLVN